LYIATQPAKRPLPACHCFPFGFGFFREGSTMAAFLSALKRAVKDFSDDECMSSGAAMAYYAIFSLPPLLVLVFLVASWSGVSQERIDRAVQSQLGMPGSSAPGEDQEGAPSDSSSGLGGIARRQSGQHLEGVNMASRVMGIALLIFSATGLFAQLQFALNRAWEVEPDPDKGGAIRFLVKRVFSFGMIVVVAFLLLISLVVTTLIDEITAHLQGASPDAAALVLGIVLNNLAVLALATVLFAAMYRILPDAKMSWKDTWIGALLTATLFVIGKTAIGWYLQSSDVGGSWGSAAASLVGVLIWVYYTSLIVLFGAELTQVWATEFGRGIEPAEGAVRKVEEKRYVPGPAEHNSSAASFEPYFARRRRREASE
jgi:membrane protein